MGLLSRSLIQALSLEDPSTPLVPYGALLESLGLGRSDAGIVVTEKQAMRLSTVYSCIKVISEDLGSLPLSVIQEMPDDSVRIAREHRIHPLLHDQPNPNMTAMTLREAWLACALAWGNGYLYIVRDRASRPVRLVLLSPEKTSAAVYEGKLLYITTATLSGQPEAIDPSDMLHILNTSLDGISGISPIRNSMNAMGLALAAEKFGALFFGNGARATGVFSHPGILDEEAYGRLKASIQQWATGDAALRPIILEEGLKWDQVTIAPDEAQFLETRRFQRSEIAALYRVPLHLLQDLDRSTNNNIEHQSIDYVKHTLRPWAVRIEQEINRKLLSGPFRAEHDLADLLRGDFASQTEGFSALRNAGAYSSNDIRRRLRENPIPEDQGGNVYLAPLNMVSLASLTQEPQAPAPAAPGGTEPPATAGRMRIETAYRRLFRDLVGRATARQGDRTAFVQSALVPVLASAAEALHALDGLPPALSPQEEIEIREHARSLAPLAADWTKENAAAAATALAAEAIRRLS